LSKSAGLAAQQDRAANCIAGPFEKKELLMTNAAAISPRPTTVFWLVTVLGSTWNLFGIYQFLTTNTASRDGLIARGMTPDQATLYHGLPIWMTIVFAIGVFGGLAGTLLLGARRRAALPLLTISLLGYLVLYVGDIMLGVFAAFGTPQVAVLTTVVLIAVGLLLFAYRARAMLG